MNKKLIAVVVAVLALSGCGNSSEGNLQDVSAAQEECHELGGTFTVDPGVYEEYRWFCDLSDEVTK